MSRIDSAELVLVRDLRHAVDAPHRTEHRGVTVTEVAPRDFDAIEWVPPAPVDHAEAIRQQLSAIVWGEYRP